MTTEPRRWQSEADRLANESIAAGDPTGWFDKLYAAGESGEVTMAWDHDTPHPLLAEWLDGQPSPDPASSPAAPGAADRAPTAVVIGCGLGADAEFLAGRGYRVTAFDLSETVIRAARQRHPDSAVSYTAANLLELPADWVRAFDLVVEIYTVQAVPPTIRTGMTAAVGELVAPGGRLLVIQGVLPDDDDGAGPPWLLTRDQIDAFGTGDLRQVDVDDPADGSGRRTWRAEFRRD